MGTYIKGMEMPTSCLNCFLSRSGCRAVLKRMRAMEARTWIPANYRHDDCPLVPIQPHGRLIDADALTISTTVPLDGKPYQYVHIDNIENAPTIIPASGGKEDE